MEILSIGEKIKRSRIYKGYTLKDICDNKVSISRMSCIENDKIKPEEWIVDLISQKLGLSSDYLKQDINCQIMGNIKDIVENCAAQEMESKLKYNLEYAEEYHYYDLAFEIMHLIFTQYINENNMDACLINTPKYYNLLAKASKEENRLVYYMDIGKYFFIIEEYSQAANYFNNISETIVNNKFKNNQQLVNAYYEEAKCYFMMKNYERSYDIAEKIVDLISFFENDEDKAKIYNLLGKICIYLNKDKFSQYEKKSYEFCKDNIKLEAKILFSYGQAFIEIASEEKAFSYIKKAANIYKNDDKIIYVEYMIKIIESLIKINKRQSAKELCDTALDLSIDIDREVYIEKAYYLKALLTEDSKDFSSREMYMNLSLDMLLKNGSKEQLYDRYMEMGNMYFKMKNNEEALKYFGLAISLNKNI